MRNRAGSQDAVIGIDVARDFPIDVARDFPRNQHWHLKMCKGS